MNSLTIAHVHARGSFSCPFGSGHVALYFGVGLLWRSAEASAGQICGV